MGQKYTPEEHLVETTKAAELIKLSYEIDLDVLADCVQSYQSYETIEPIRNPTKWRIEGESIREATKVVAAVLHMARLAREARDKAPEVNERSRKARSFSLGEW
jgi:hypothetical protein